MENKIIINFNNIVSELETKGLKLCKVKDRSWFVVDSQNNMYHIELYRSGSYLDQLIKDGITVEFNYVDASLSKNIGEWEKEIWGVSEVKDFIKRQKIQIKDIVTELEQIKTESQEVIGSINTETLETQKESLEAISNQLDKVQEVIEKNIDNEEIRLQLRDIENNLKYNYSGLYEMIEKQTCPDANDFNNIETLKTVYITNWNELPQEIQNYILSCNRYWIDLQEIILYHDSQAVASIGISGHHKHDIEINSIGAGEKGGLFQWNTTDGYTFNNLTQDQEPTSNKELNNIINTYTDTKEIEANRTLYRGSISKEVLYNIYQNSTGYKDLYIEYYQMIICNDEPKAILTYCEGDFIAEVYNSESDYKTGIERTKKFIDEM